MNLRIGFYIFCSVAIISIFASCLGGDDNTEYYTPIDAQITAFDLKHDSFPDLSKVKFTIDQVNGLIYNHDSMAYQTKIYEKVIVNFTTAALGVVNVTNIAEKDSTVLASGDSLDVSKSVSLNVYAYDGTLKHYLMKLNIHQVDPDSIQYKQVATNQLFLNADQLKTVYLNGTFYNFSKTNAGTKLYRSADAVNWTELALSGFPEKGVVSEIQKTAEGLFVYTSDGQLYSSSDAQSWKSISTTYPVKAIFGNIIQSSMQVAGMTYAVQKDGKIVFAFTPDNVSWTYGNEIPQGFPLTGFSSVKQYAMTVDRITVVSGVDASGNTQNAAWSTTNGLQWARITDTTHGLFPLMLGPNIFEYNNSFYVLNGKLSDGTYNKNTYRSIDGGATWQVDISKTFVPENYSGRYNASVVVDKDNYIYIVGGKQQSNLTDIWKGLLNKLFVK